MKPTSIRYAAVDDRIADLLVPLTEVELEQTVRSCPEWSIHDLVRHVTAGLVGACAGEREVWAQLTASPYEVLMMLTGRSTLDDIAALRWEGPYEPLLDIISSYEPPRARTGEHPAHPPGA